MAEAAETYFASVCGQRISVIFMLRGLRRRGRRQPPHRLSHRVERTVNAILALVSPPHGNYKAASDELRPAPGTSWARPGAGGRRAGARLSDAPCLSRDRAPGDVPEQRGRRDRKAELGAVRAP